MTHALTTTDHPFPSETGVVLPMPAASTDLASPADIEAAMKAFDGQQFIQEVLGQAIGKWFYGFKIAGKDVEGVSAKGAHEFARLRAEQGFPIRVPPYGVSIGETTQNGELGVRAIVTMREYRSGQEAVGTAFYPYNSKRKDGTIEYDRFADRKALAVAERNAILRLIPETTIVIALKERQRIVAANERALNKSLPASKTESAPRAVAPETAGPVTADLGGAADFVCLFGHAGVKGKRLGDIPRDVLMKHVAWTREKMPGKYQDFLEAAGEVLAEGADDDLGF